MLDTSCVQRARVQRARARRARVLWAGLWIGFGFLLSSAVLAESFQTVEQHETGTRPVAIAVADFDNDGKDDSVVVHEGTAVAPADARVLMAGQSGVLTLDPAVYGLTIPGILILVKDVVTGRFDTDAFIDFAVLVDGAALGSGVWLFSGDGTGGFTSAGIFRDLALVPTSLATGDLNGDGEDDFVVGHAAPTSGGQVGVLLSDGAGGYLSAFHLSAGPSVSDVALADLDADGHLDITALSPATSGPNDSVEVFWGDGAGAFPATVSFGTDPEPKAVAAADFRNVGRQDLFVVHQRLDGSGPQGSSKLRHFEHQPGRVFTSSGPITGAQCPLDVVATDFDNDGRADVAVINGRVPGSQCSWSNNTGTVLLWDVSSGAFDFGSTFTSGWESRQLAAGDFDGDLAADIVVANYGSVNTPTSMNVVVDVQRDPNPTGVTIRFEDVLPGLGSGSGSNALKSYVKNGVGGGAVVGDLDNDGWPDIYLVDTNGQSNVILRHRGPTASFGPGGDPFELISNHGAEATPVGATGAVIVDFDNDGWNDIYVTGSVGFSEMGGCNCEPNPANPPPPDGYCRVIQSSKVPRMENRLYINDGAAAGGGWSGTFTDRTTAAGVIDLLTQSHPSGDIEILRGNTRAVTAADFDRDGWVDIYTGNFFMNGCGGGSNVNLGMPNGLYRNAGVNGTGTPLTYVEMAAPAGVVGTLTNGDPNLSWGGSALALFAADVDGNGWVDLYVANDMDLPDGSPLYLNNGATDTGAWSGTFAERAFGNGIHDKTPAGMGADVGDWNGDLLLDFAVSDGTGPQGANVGCALYQQKPALDVGQAATDGTAAFADKRAIQPALVSTVFDVVDIPNPIGAGFGWQIGWEDFDLDGDEDLHITSTKYVMDMLWRNDGVDGAGRPILSNIGGRTFDHRTEARGAAYADFDRDGWIDVFQVNPNENARLFINRSGLLPGGQPIPNPPHWLQIYPRITVPNPSLPLAAHREAIGARIEVFADVDGDGFTERQVRVIQAGEGASGSMSEAVARFGLGQATTASVKIFWPDGSAQRLPSVAADQRLTVIR